MTEETLRKLEYGFAKGLTDNQACLFADIAPSTLYLYIEKNPEFSERKELLKQNVKIKAKMNIAESIESGNLYDSKWYLEKTDKEFANKQEIDLGNKDDKPFEVNINVVR